MVLKKVSMVRETGRVREGGREKERERERETEREAKGHSPTFSIFADTLLLPLQEYRTTRRKRTI